MRLFAQVALLPMGHLLFIVDHFLRWPLLRPTQAQGEGNTMPKEVPKIIRHAAAFAGLLLILLINSYFLHYAFRSLSQHQDWVNHTLEVIAEIEATVSSLKDVETGARGYTLSRQDEHLKPYQQGVSDVWLHLQRFRVLTSDNPVQQRAANEVERLLRERLQALSALVAGASDKRKSAESLIPIVERGRETMERIRLLAQSMETSERELLSARAEQVERQKLLFLFILFATTVISVGSISFAFLQFKRNQDRMNQELRERTFESWTRENIAEAARVTAGDISLPQTAKGVLEFLAKLLNLPAAKLFVVEGAQLTLAGAHGLDLSEAEDKRHLGLALEAAKRQDLWSVPEVPKEYWHIRSGLGSANPGHLLFMPLLFQSRVVGLVEMAAFSPPSSEQITLLSELTGTLGIGLNAVISRDKLQELLEETRQQSEELQAQQEELRSNNEELEQQARALESQQQAMAVKNDELEAARADLQSRADELRRSSQYKSEFLAKMSHELRTPLNGILILSSLLMEDSEGNLNEKQKGFARSVFNAGNDLLLLINDILDLSKIEARKLEVRPEKFQLKTLLSQIQQMFEHQAASKGLGFSVDASEEVANKELFTDAQRLEQILRNFLANAIKFTEKGKVSLRVAPSGQDYLKFSVMDTGIGIPSHQLKKIFEAFEQSDGSISRKYGGTGLGLSISRELANLLGAKIELSSLEGEGSEFSILLPLRWKGELAPEQKPMAPEEKKNIEQIPFSAELKSRARKRLSGLVPDKKTILVVEDDEKFRGSVVDTVKSNGFQAIEAADGEEALFLLSEYVPDAILLDIKLPGVSGLGVLEMTKQTPRLRHVPIHMISALNYQHNALRLGAMGYLTKPVTVQKVRSALQRIEKFLSERLRKVLIVEDDHKQSQGIRELISGDDVEVVAAGTGKTAVRELSNNTFDCVILDLTLPDISGFELLSELSSLPISLPPIVVYTGKDLTKEEEEYLRRFSESIIIKGARSPERLLDEVNLFLHRVESLLPTDKQSLLSQMRSREHSFQGKTVLLVDDDLRNVFALASALEAKGLNVRIAKDGIESLEVLEKHNDIDLVLMDIMMPRMDGFETMRHIRKSSNERVRKLPIIALTAKAMKEDHERCIEAGANDYLPKPVNLNNLNTVLRVWLASGDLA